MTHRDFLERALVAGGEWARFADPKLLAALVLLGLGTNDLIDHGRGFLHPHQAASASCSLVSAQGHSCAGLIATGGFCVAATLAAVTVLYIVRGLFPQLTMRGLLPGDDERGAIKSHFYFGEVARHGSQEAYRAAVKNKREHELLDDIAGQVYEVAKIAQAKHRAAQRAFLWALAFLAAWAVARLVLAGM